MPFPKSQGAFHGRPFSLAYDKDPGKISQDQQHHNDTRRDQDPGNLLHVADIRLQLRVSLVIKRNLYIVDSQPVPFGQILFDGPVFDPERGCAAPHGAVKHDIVLVAVFHRAAGNDNLLIPHSIFVHLAGSSAIDSDDGIFAVLKHLIRLSFGIQIHITASAIDGVIDPRRTAVVCNQKRKADLIPD